MFHSAEQLDLSVLNEAAVSADAIMRPEAIDHLYASSPDERVTDEAHGIRGVMTKVAALSKPAVCLLGPYSSGKTFLLNHFLSDDIFISKMEPTTAVITVIRHVGDKPVHWPAAHNVFTLKTDADLRTLDLDCITGGYDYKNLPVLTTYPEALRHEAVIVFLDKDILRKCTFYDCPGVGTMAESTFEADTDPDADPTLSQKQWESIRERDLQLKAIANADAYILLSSLTGGNGSFADANTGSILYTVATHMARFPTAVPNGNLLFVGSQADSAKEGLEDEASVLRKLQEAIQKQVEKLPHEQRQKFDVDGLEKRIVLFFALDAHQRATALSRARVNFKRYNPDVCPPDVERAARAQVEVDLHSRERTTAFDAELLKLIDQLSDKLNQNRTQVLAQALDASVLHYASKQTRYEHTCLYAKLSARYELEFEARERAWREIAADFEADVDHSSAATLQGCEAIFRHWSTERNVYELLAGQFGYDELRPRTLAEECADVAIDERVKSDFDRLLLEHLLLPQKATYERLLAFDVKWIRRRADEGINPDPPNEGGIPFVNAVLAAQTFNGIAHGLWAVAKPAVTGRPVLEVLQGSTLAQAGLGRTAPILSSGSIFAFPEPHASDRDEHICSSLIGARVQRVVRARLRARSQGLLQGTLANEIAAALSWEQVAPRDSARAAISGVFSEVRQLGIKSLAVTKGVLDWHLREVHVAAGRGVLTPIQLSQAINFYAAHGAQLKEARGRVAQGAKLPW